MKITVFVNQRLTKSVINGSAEGCSIALLNFQYLVFEICLCRKYWLVLKLPIMIVTLELEPEVELTAAEQAREEGLPLTEYVESVVKEAVFKRKRIRQLSEKSFDEILKPFRNEVKTSKISDDELDNLFRQARREASEARQNK